MPAISNKSNELNLKGFAFISILTRDVFGYILDKKNIRRLIGGIVEKWIFIHRPDLYFTYFARPNTIRLDSESLLFGLASL